MRTAKGCCEQYGANDDVVGRWLAAAVRLLLIYDNLRITANRKVKSAPSSRELLSEAKLRE